MPAQFKKKLLTFLVTIALILAFITTLKNNVPKSFGPSIDNATASARIFDSNIGNAMTSTRTFDPTIGNAITSTRTLDPNIGNATARVTPKTALPNNSTNAAAGPAVQQYNGTNKLARRLFAGMRGIEIGAAMYNPYGLDAWNVDYTDEPTSIFQKHQVEVSGKAAKVHIIAPGDKLPFTNNSLDFVINSHVLEHFYDPIKAIEEWLRVVKPGGFVYMDIPHKERTFDQHRNRTTLSELLERHGRQNPEVEKYQLHHSVWITEDVLELCRHFNWTVVEWLDADDKLGIGFIVVIKKME